MYSTHVLTLLALHVGLAHSFPWDIVVGGGNRLEFYYNGNLTHTEYIPSVNHIVTMTYDSVQDRVMLTHKDRLNVFISCFDLSTKKLQTFVTRDTKDILSIAYDPVTQLLFWKNHPSIYSISLDPASSNKAVDENVLVTLDRICRDIAVDSCGGYIYWITHKKIERARFDGSNREVLIHSSVNDRLSLAIDQQTQRIYWIEKDNYNIITIESANFIGENRRTFYTVRMTTLVNSLTVSKDFISFKDDEQRVIWQIPKNGGPEMLYPIFNAFNQLGCTAAKYSINDQIQDNRNCEILKSLKTNSAEQESTDVTILCVHGTKVSGESRCKCTQGFSGERCDVAICQNHCFQGDCIVSAEGKPKCSCKAGYSGERCEVNACHKHCLNNAICSLNEEDEPVCQCTTDYEGDRCDISICKGYCLQGNCGVSSEGQPYCRCNAGFGGKRCELPAFLIKCIQTVSTLKDILNADIPPVTLDCASDNEVKSTCDAVV